MDSDEEEPSVTKQRTSSDCGEFENEGDSQIDNSTGSSRDSTEIENNDCSDEIID